MPYLRVCGQRPHRLERDVARRRVQVIDAGKHQLHGAALRADDEIDAASVALEALADLSIHDPDEPDRSHAERQQQDVEERAERLRAEIAPGQAGEIHAAATTEPRESGSTVAIRSLRRESWVAMTSAAPCRFVASSRSSATAVAASSSRLEVGSSASTSVRPIYQRTGNGDTLLLADG